MPFDILYILSGAFVGFIVGLTGVGGGSLMTPILVLLFGIHPATAVGTDLLYAAATKGIGSLVHGWKRNIDWRVVGLLATGSVPAAAATLFILSRLGPQSAQGARVITVVLGGALLLTAALLIFRKWLMKLRGIASTPNPVREALLTILTGAAIGLLVSITSVGAGAIGVTALLMLYPTFSIVRVVGTDIAHAVPLTLVAGIGHWFMGSVDVTMLVSLLMGSIPGIVLGSYSAPHVPDRSLRIILAIVLTAVGIKLILN
ncbi:MAG: sulfite exporter TauE/SafE family protein [Rhodospirillaceae bacterium]|nr:sulfite exporter TauE/SafE family protein [Rhodospirillaceae bacterium]